MLNIDLNLVRVFLAVYRSGSIGGAAKQLNLTQPAVSNALARLNAALNCQLFVRAGRGIKASEEAHNLYQKIDDSYEQIQRAFLEFSDFDPSVSSRHFRVSLSNYFDSMLPDLARELQTEAPNILFERAQYQLEGNVAAMREGVLDLMLLAIELKTQGFSHQPLITDEMVLVSRVGHPILQKRKTVSLATMRGLRFASLIEVHEHAMPAYHVLRDNKIGVFLRTVSFTNLLEIAANTDYVALMPKYLVKNWRYFPVRHHKLPFPTSIPLSLMWPKTNDNDSGHKWLRDTVIRTFLAAETNG